MFGKIIKKMALISWVTRGGSCGHILRITMYNQPFVSFWEFYKCIFIQSTSKIFIMHLYLF